MLFGRMMGIVPLGVGLTVLGFVWTQPQGGFGAMPLFFRIFASFIALAFVMMGAQILSGKLTDPKRLLQTMQRLRSQLPSEPSSGEHGQVGYQCPGCGAPLDATADVSPHGDVKCTHCERWFNIHGRTRA